MLWIEGLLFKLKKLRVEGHMFKWIRSFLTSRTIQVKIGNSHSEKLTLENGTPQGSVISPLLFLLMINDIPDLNQDTRKAIFADDCAIWKSGRDVDQVIKELQIDLNISKQHPLLVQQMGIPTFERKNHGYNIRTSEQDRTTAICH